VPYSTDGCSPAGCLVATARPVLMPLRLHEFADFANYQLPEIGSQMLGWRRKMRNIAASTAPANRQCHGTCGGGGVGAGRRTATAAVAAAYRSVPPVRLPRRRSRATRYPERRLTVARVGMRWRIFTAATRS
jgi:hypothetical protein